MASSIFRNLTASILRNVSTLKRDAKRLQKKSEQVFGVEYPLGICQQALAVSRGFISFADLQAASQRLGQDRRAPFWTLHSRTDSHQDLLEAIYQLELDFTESGPIVFTGNQSASAKPAAALFFERMSWKAKPGLILVETEAPVFQDTALYRAVADLGLTEILNGFRVIDLREKNLPVALNTSSACWSNAISNALDEMENEVLRDAGWQNRLTWAEHERDRSQTSSVRQAFHPISFFSFLEEACRLPALKNLLEWRYEAQKEAADAAQAALNQLLMELNGKSFSQGVSCSHESLVRPYLVLFSRNNRASEVLADVVQSYFCTRPSRDDLPPILYFSDGSTPYVPKMIAFGSHTAIVNGVTSIPMEGEPGYVFAHSQAIRVYCTDTDIQYMGSRVAIT
ncbi:hypothetical protein C4K06_6156 [Pseudomonas chlororaphis subsp. aureofaciens]|uniref:hypothetical protein n=1 Tax=Pseudomonas chlororaphis TaxID=587753 RepID=UPI000F583D39|nr:hypothetical protein [Pseudomonas chlororaphis]AZE39144.1 hypothetical protein C4K06_6156 [Pseudomonas chlororaphis subsp. aureofaciens]